MNPSAKRAGALLTAQARLRAAFSRIEQARDFTELVQVAATTAAYARRLRSEEAAAEQRDRRERDHRRASRKRQKARRMEGGGVICGDPGTTIAEELDARRRQLDLEEVERSRVEAGPARNDTDDEEGEGDVWVD